MVQELVKLKNWQSLLDMLLQIKPMADNMKEVLITEAMDCVIIEIFDVYGRICKGIARVLMGIYSAGKLEATMAFKILQKAKVQGKDVFINQERKLGARRRSDTVLVSTINDADQGSADVTYRTPPAPYEKSKSLGSGGSMVARLKLKGIDGRAPPGVEPAA